MSHSSQALFKHLNTQNCHTPLKTNVTSSVIYPDFLRQNLSQPVYTVFQLTTLYYGYLFAYTIP